MITSDTINTARAALAQLPARDRKRTAVQALGELKVELLQSRERGYSDAEICSRLAQLGIKASRATLRRALAATRGKPIKSRARARAAGHSLRAVATEQSIDLT